MSRVTRNVQRPDAVAITIDGVEIRVFPGETVASAILMSDRARFRVDRSGRARGMFCNMGVCSECFVWVEGPGSPRRRLRACLTPVSAGMAVNTDKRDGTT